MAKEYLKQRKIVADNLLAGLLLHEDATKEQARAAVTVYCMLLDIQVDTMDWDYLIRDLFFTYNNWFDSMEEMDSYMSELLV